MDKAKRILVAETPAATLILQPALQGHFDLTVSHSLAGALQHLKEHIHIVLCGLHFDESRMFELLKHLKASESMKHVPFISINATNTVLPDSVIRMAAKAAISIGSDGFIDLARWRAVLGDDRAFARLRAHLHLL